jgi:hypothetical protein
LTINIMARRIADLADDPAARADADELTRFGGRG